MSGSFDSRAGRSCFSRPLPDHGTVIESYRRLAVARVRSLEGRFSPFDRDLPLACLDRAPLLTSGNALAQATSKLTPAALWLASTSRTSAAAFITLRFGGAVNGPSAEGR
jgi:hypothetical protein